MYAKITNGVVNQYPYTIGQLRRDNPNISFPKIVGAETLKSFDVYPVQNAPYPSFDNATQRVEPKASPEIVGDEWVIGWNIIDLSQEEVSANEKLNNDMQAAQVRAERDRLLAECDWVTIKAVDASADGLGIQLPQVWIDYRKALRDIPSQAGFPWTVAWPDKP